MADQQTSENHHLLGLSLDRTPTYTYGSIPKPHRKNPFAASSESVLRRWIARVGSQSRTFLPCTQWVPHYRWEYLSGDFMGAATVAAIYAPLSVSFAFMSHAHPTSGMLSFVICSLVYALLGHCPQMIIGPEAPGSLLVGIAVRLAGTGSTGNDPVRDAQFAGAVTSAAGTVLLVAGLGRLGFLSCILHRPFMRGFVLSLGLGVVVEQTTPALRLPNSTSTLGPQASIAKKVGLITDQLKHLHSLSAMLSITSLIGVLICRYMRQKCPNIGAYRY